MEGLDQLRPREALSDEPGPENRMVERWVAFLFGAVLLCVIAGSLLAAALAPLAGLGD